jgi:hypothetical protein
MPSRGFYSVANFCHALRRDPSIRQRLGRDVEISNEEYLRRRQPSASFVAVFMYAA